MNSLFNFGIGVIVVLVVLSNLRSCTSRSSARYGDNYNVTVQQTVTQDAAAGLDLQAVGELVKRAKTGEEFERLLNDASTGVNNLDLDEDGKVDFVKVTEYGSGTVKGFSLTVDLAEGQTQEVATIEIEKTSDGQANLQTYGNPAMYGSNHYYHSQTSLTDLLLVGWLFSANRPFYSSPWGYNNHPTDYRPYTTRSYDAYRSDVSRTTSRSNWNRANASTLTSKPASPNAGKSAANIKAPLKSPTTSQKSFQARNPSKQVQSGGFGSKTVSRPSPTVRSSRTSSFRSGGK
ncbi:MAG: hypothetical protein K9N62_01965 [Verrucomicrobia bacterium]|nr:hypothetical protein [Verrucomicrobiota bacterium]